MTSLAWLALPRTSPSSGSGTGSRSAEISAAAPRNKVALSRILDIAPGCPFGGQVTVRTIVQLDRAMRFPLTLAEGLRTTFADVGSSPLPERLAALVRQFGADSGRSEDER